MRKEREAETQGVIKSDGEREGTKRNRLRETEGEGETKRLREKPKYNERCRNGEKELEKD